MKYEIKHWNKLDPPFTMGQVAWLTNPHNPQAVKMLKMINQMAEAVDEVFGLEKIKTRLEKQLESLSRKDNA